MEQKELKEKMMKLWKNTFHDSDAYISLIFDNYFNPDLVEYYEENGKLISALLGVPYEFSNGKQKLQGLYLCGLATIEEYRHNGIMNNLLEKINRKGSEMGYTFSFLIPANDALINYYSMRKYETAIYRVEDRYTELHNFTKDYISSLIREDERIRILREKQYENTVAEFADLNDKKLVDDIIDFIYSSEKNISTYLTLQHSKKDIGIVVSENMISGGKCIISYAKDKILSGAAFICFDERKRIHIKKIYYKDQCSLYRILDYIKSKYPESPISLYCYPEECDRKAIWDKVYGGPGSNGDFSGGSYDVTERVYNVSNHAKPYGMVRILNLHEILKFIAMDRKDSKFSILVKGGSEKEISMKYDISNGNVAQQEVASGDLASYVNKPNISVLTEREFLEILFRKRGSSNLIQEAFDIPRLPINMALLLD